ncbi:hypothetical protein [Streptomyces sp. NPDC056982]|uniref:hypothetical protein n=1 Tax=Streptomyces sp. NPDC056982 TaxID=3345986 RepID=UPI00362DBE89
MISRVGVPQYEEAPIGFGSLFRPNLRVAGGAARVRAYIEELMPDILNGTIEPGKVFDATTNLDGVPPDTRTWPTARSSRSSSIPDFQGHSGEGRGPAPPPGTKTPGRWARPGKG